MKEITEIRERWSKASPGPWFLANGNEVHDRKAEFNEMGARIGDTPNLLMIEKYPNGRANAEAFANAPADIAYLLAEVDRLEASERVAKAAHVYIRNINSPLCVGWDDLLEALQDWKQKEAAG